MIYPEKNRLIWWLFDRYIKGLVKRNFHAVNFNSIELEKGRSVLLLANHFSWWDGFILYYLNSKLLKKNFHIMVIKETMQQVKFFKYLGAFSVNKSSRTVVDALAYAAKLLNNPGNLVVIFPQGRLYSNFTTDVRFEKGVIKIIKHAGDNIQTIIATSFVENFNHKKPVVNIYLQKLHRAKFENITELNDIYQQHYNAARQQQTEIVL
jgi:1-acyl-sn-glycerol-3-phosphate acyltransferase